MSGVLASAVLLTRGRGTGAAGTGSAGTGSAGTVPHGPSMLLAGLLATAAGARGP
jgi:hypothetical protein